MGPFKAKHIGEDKGKVREPRGICKRVHTGNSVCKEIKHRGTHSKSRTSNLWGRGKNVGGNSRVNRVRRQGVNKINRKLVTEDVEKRWKKCTSGYDRVFRTRDSRKTKCVMRGEVSALFSSKRVNIVPIFRKAPSKKVRPNTRSFPTRWKL